MASGISYVSTGGIAVRSAGSSLGATDCTETMGGESSMVRMHSGTASTTKDMGAQSKIVNQPDCPIAFGLTGA
jgi:hypothetical protein